MTTNFNINLFKVYVPNFVAEISLEPWHPIQAYQNEVNNIGWLHAFDAAKIDSQHLVSLSKGLMLMFNSNILNNMSIV